MDGVKVPVAERLHGGGQGGHADAQPGIEGNLDLGRRPEAPVDLRVGADDLDLEAWDPRRRISPMSESPRGCCRSRRPAATRAPSRRRAASGARCGGGRCDIRELGSLAARKAVAGAYGITAIHDSNTPCSADRLGAGRPRVAPRPARRARPPGAGCARGPGGPAVEGRMAEALLLHQSSRPSRRAPADRPRRATRPAGSGRPRA